MDQFKLTNEQKVLAEKLVLTDAIEKNNLFGAISIIYSHDMIISVIIVYNTIEKKVIEKRFYFGKAKFPYNKEFICYRDSEIIMKTFQLLETKPNIIFVEGDGICHPRRMGIASYIGLLVDIPTIGINSINNFGVLDGDAIYYNKEIIAKIIITKEISKPIYISQGHRISLSTAIEYTRQFLKGHKLPEPLHLAHKYAAKIKNSLKLVEPQNKNTNKIRVNFI